MSAGNVDILVKAREDAISVLKQVQREIRATGTVSEQTRKAYQETRKEVVLSQRSLTTLTAAYRDQYEAVYLAGRAFSDISSIIGRVLDMYEQYNVAMIRQTQLQHDVADAQKTYNDALSNFGPGSTQATDALGKLTDAENTLKDAQEKNTAMMLGFIAQIPGFIGPILNAGIAVKVLSDYLAAQAVATDIASASNVGLTGSIVAAAAGLKAEALAAIEAAGGLTTLAAAASIVTAIGAILIISYQEQQEELAKYGAAFGATAQEIMMLEAQARRMAISTDELISRVREGTANFNDFGDAGKTLEEKIKGTGQAQQDLIGWVVSTADAERRQTEATKKLTDQYIAGEIDARAFAEQMLALGVSAKDVADILSKTEVKLPVPTTWQEDFVKLAQDTTTAFKDAFTGPMAELGPAMSSTMSDLVNVTISAIDSGLIGQAQSGMQAFRDCVSGKMNDLPGIQQQAMDSLVTLTNEAINQGLKGEAQENIALFVQCAQSKTLSMVQEIDGYLKELQEKVKQNTETITDLEKQGKDDEAEIYRKANEDIQQALDQLDKWKQQIISGTPIDEVIPGIKDASADAKTLMAEVTTAIADIPEDKKISITVDDKDARNHIDDIAAALAEIRDKNVTITVNYATTGELPSLQVGGYIPATGPYLLHEGEEVLPASGIRSEPPRAAAREGFRSELTVPIIVQLDGVEISRTVKRVITEEANMRSRFGGVPS